MTILAAEASELLAGMAAAVPGIGACVVGADGEVGAEYGATADLRVRAVGDWFEVEQPGRWCVTAALPKGGMLVATAPAGAPQLHAWLEAMLQALVHSERLERDMESMNLSSLQLLEQVSMLGETLPKLSACETVADVATTGLKACVVAAGVRRAVYLHLHEQAGVCEVLAYVETTAHGQVVARPYPGAPIIEAGAGIVGEALRSGDTVVLRPARGRIAAADPEGLGEREVLGVQVGYDAGGERVCLGAILLFDKAYPGYAQQSQLGSEEGQVAASFASMLGAVLGARQTAELGKELSMAQAIQGQILPARPAAVRGFELAGDYRTSGDVGGDYFDYVPMADGRTMVIVADVSGHNLASGMMMVSARATLRALAANGRDGAHVFAALAASMYQDLVRTEQFITAAGVVLREGDLRVEVVNAGHNGVLHYCVRDRAVRTLGDSSPILGFLPRVDYSPQTVELAPGDCLLLYTDGATEAMDGSGEMFGETRLADVLARAAGRGARGVVDAVLQAVRQFQEPQRRGDDVTVVAIVAAPHQGEQP